MDCYSTHDVENQVEPLVDYSLFETDIALQENVRREGAAHAEPALIEHGHWLGRAATLAAGQEANRHPPEFRPYDANGRRIDAVSFHPAWHALMTGIVGRGMHSGPWARPAPGAQVARAAFYLMQGQVEAGTLCPTTMTFASLAVLGSEPAGEVDFAADWLPKLYSLQYDASDQPVALKRGVLIGMGMTEKQGGSDVRSNSTRAKPLAAPGRGRAYRLVGHKWFYSVPQSDAHLVLAQTNEGLSCFFVPRWQPDGTHNAVRIQRLKDKLGNRSNASAEVEFCDAWAVMVGEPGRGIVTLMDMITHTRLDCVAGSAALLRQGLVQALHHCSGRSAFGARLVEKPLMRQVLADLALESEAATALSLRLAGAAERPDDLLERALCRIVTPAAKFWVCKRSVAALGECMETWGGNGYVEDGPMPRLYREAPINSIWEGSGNVMCLDVLRALDREQEGFAVLVAELRNCVGIHAAYDLALDAWLALCADTDRAPLHARRIAGMLALLVQSSLLMRYSPGYVWETFIASRLGASSWILGDAMATTASDATTEQLLVRAWPPIAA